MEDNSGKVVYFLEEEHTRFDCMGKVLTPKREHSNKISIIKQLHVHIHVDDGIF